MMQYNTSSSIVYLQKSTNQTAKQFVGKGTPLKIRFVLGFCIALLTTQMKQTRHSLSYRPRMYNPIVQIPHKAYHQ